MNGQKIMERSTIEEVVLEQIYKLAGINPPPPGRRNVFSGYPLSVQARGACMDLLWSVAAGDYHFVVGTEPGSVNSEPVPLEVRCENANRLIISGADD